MWMEMVQGSGLWKFVEFIVTFLHHITQRKASTDCFASMPVLCKSKWNGSSEMIHNASCSKLNLMRFVHISQDGNDCVLAPPSAKNDKLYAKRASRCLKCVPIRSHSKYSNVSLFWKLTLVDLRDLSYLIQNIRSELYRIHTIYHFCESKNNFCFL